MKLDRLDVAAIPYHWVKANAGYSWVRVKVPHSYPVGNSKQVQIRREKEWLLVENDRSDRRAYSDYEAPADLFDRFANVGRTREDIKAFADQFGQLGFEKTAGAFSFDDPISGMHWPGELLHSWDYAIVQLQDTMALWRAILKARDGNPSDLSRRVDWHLNFDRGLSKVTVFRDPDHKRGGPGWLSFFSDEEVFRSFKHGDVVRPAEEFLRREIMSHLSAQLSISLAWDRSNDFAAKLRRSFRPASLLGLLWLQFADALTEVTIFRPCKSCGKLILISPSEGARSHRLTCSDRCRVALYQERVRGAVASFGQGKNLEEIARGAGAELLTVKRWIARGLSKRGDTVSAIASRLGMGVAETRRVLAKGSAKRD